MASIAKLAEILLGLSTGPNAETQGVSTSGVTAANSTTAGIEDQFTLSGQDTAQAAGVYTTQSVPLSTSAAGLLPIAVSTGAAALGVQSTANPLTTVTNSNAALQ